MSIKTIFSGYKSDNPSSAGTTLASLIVYCNSGPLVLKEAITTKVGSLVALAALDFKKPENFFYIIANSYKDQFVLNINMALVRCSLELLNPSNTDKSLDDLLSNVTTGFDTNGRSKVIGETHTAMAFGFVLGTAIKRGIKANEFLKSFTDTFNYSDKDFIAGLITGLDTSSKSLASNIFYTNSLVAKYSTYGEFSLNDVLAIFKAIKTTTIEKVYINIDNLVILESFEDQSDIIRKLLVLYRDEIRLNEETNTYSTSSEDELTTLTEGKNKISHTHNASQGIQNCIEEYSDECDR